MAAINFEDFFFAITWLGAWAEVFSIPHSLLSLLTNSRDSSLTPRNFKEIYKLKGLNIRNTRWDYLII